jgi:hypothetical protein
MDKVSSNSTQNPVALYSISVMSEATGSKFISMRSMILSLVFLSLAAVTNAAMDELQFHFDKSIFSKMESHRKWLDPKISWHNKWKNGDSTQGEAFWGSSTVFCGFTDAWHFFKGLMISCFVLAIMIPVARLVSLRWYFWVLIFFGLNLLYGFVFELFFSKLFLS